MKKIRIFALLAACVMFLSAYLLIKEREDKAREALNTPEEKTVTRVVASANIRPYTVLNATNTALETVKIPADEELTGCFSTLEEVDGKVAYSDIFKGEVITPKRALDPDDEKLGLSMQITKGMRAVTMKVDTEQAVGYNLQVGNRVDLIFTKSADFSIEGSEAKLSAGQGLTEFYGEDNPANTVIYEENQGNKISTIVLQNLKVVAVSNVIYRTNLSEYNHITLEATPEDAAKITLMEKSGDLSIILRATGDDEITKMPRSEVLPMYTEDAGIFPEPSVYAVPEEETESAAEEPGEVSEEEEEAMP